MATPLRRSAFSLVEMLVVIGIVAALIGILLPVLSVARQESKSIQCLGNLRQLGMLVSVYCNKYQERYPIAYYTDAAGNTVNWDFTVPPIPGARLLPGLLWEDDNSGFKIQQCPSYEGPAAGAEADPFTGYNYNTSFIGHGDQETPITAPIKTSQVTNPSRTALFGDGQIANGSDKFMRSPFLSDQDQFPYRAAGTQGYRHRGRTNVCYCDGHAATVYDCFTASDDPNVAPGTGFLSIDNSAYDPR